MCPRRFSVSGKMVDRYPDVMEELRAAGHEIGNHTQSHESGWKHIEFHLPQKLFSLRNALRKHCVFVRHMGELPAHKRML